MSYYDPPPQSIFKDPAHEWLRIAATADPDWNLLRKLGARITDWRAVWSDGQLNGVACWRILDPRLDGIVPEETREECRRHQETLYAKGQQWWEQSVTPAVRALEAAGVVWVTNSGPVQYLPLGIPFWPRTWDDFDIFVPAEHHHQARRALEAAGFVFAGLVCETQNPVYRLADGSGGLEIIGLPPEHPDLPGWAWHHRAEFYQDRLLREVRGLPMWTPRAEWMVALMAYRTYVAYCRQATPLPLWGLSRLWAWRQWIGSEWDEAEFVRAIRLALEVDWSPTRHLPNVTWGRGILFSLEIASRLYGSLVPTELAGLLEGPFRFLVSEPGEGHRGVTEEIMEIASWPSDEDVLFDLGRGRSSQVKLERGHWRRME